MANGQNGLYIRQATDEYAAPSLPFLLLSSASTVGDFWHRLFDKDDVHRGGNVQEAVGSGTSRGQHRRLASGVEERRCTARPGDFFVVVGK